MTRKKLIPIVIALGAAIIATGYYVLSGRSSYDANVRNLSAQDQVAEVNGKNPQLIEIKCKDGRSYQIKFNNPQTSYDDLVFSACGEAGTQQAQIKK